MIRVQIDADRRVQIVVGKPHGASQQYVLKSWAPVDVSEEDWPPVMAAIEVSGYELLTEDETEVIDDGVEYQLSDGDDQGGGDDLTEPIEQPDDEAGDESWR